MKGAGCTGGAAQQGLRRAAAAVGRGRLRILCQLAQAFPLQPAKTAAVPDSSADFPLQKNDDELRFFVAHPALYHPSLVALARQELQRRGAPLEAPAPPTEASAPLASAPAPAAETPAPAYSYTPVQAKPASKLGLILGVLAVVLLGLAGYYLNNQQSEQAAARDAALAAAKARRGPPVLTEVATSALPTYDGLVAQCVAEQLLRVPAAERTAAAAAGHPLRQYRELTKRFWAAQTQTEYLTDQARRGLHLDLLPQQGDVVLTTWQQWDKAMAYHYKLGPVMSSHVDVMARVAREQQDALSDLQAAAAVHDSVQTAKTARSDADLSDLLASLRATSPVTGRPYQAQVRHVRL